MYAFDGLIHGSATPISLLPFAFFERVRDYPPLMFVPFSAELFLGRNSHGEAEGVLARAALEMIDMCY